MLLNSVSFYDKNHATGCSFLIKVMRQGIKVDKKIMRQGITWKNILLEFCRNNLVKFLCDTGYTFGAFFVRQGTVCGEICHTCQSPSLSITPGGKVGDDVDLKK